MRYGVGDFCHVQSARGGGLSAVLRGLSEHLPGLRGAEGLEGEAALGHAVARELTRDGGHELLGTAWKSTERRDAKFDFHAALYGPWRCRAGAAAVRRPSGGERWQSSCFSQLSIAREST